LVARSPVRTTNLCSVQNMNGSGGGESPHVAGVNIASSATTGLYRNSRCNGYQQSRFRGEIDLAVA
jgi:hypothetical protein